MNYDNWKLDNPDFEDEDQIYCGNCGIAIDSGFYCSNECRWADEL